MLGVIFYLLWSYSQMSDAETLEFGLSYQNIQVTLEQEPDHTIV